MQEAAKYFLRGVPKGVANTRRSRYHISYREREGARARKAPFLSLTGSDFIESLKAKKSNKTGTLFLCIILSKKCLPFCLRRGILFFAVAQDIVFAFGKYI